MDFKNSNTFKNLQYALDGELKASTKYQIYASKAREDGFEQIGNIFDETSKNERKHGELWLKLLNKACVPYTLDNLEDAFRVENHEWTDMYPAFAQEAQLEGYHDIAALFEGVSNIERHHDYRFRELARNIESGEVFCKKIDVLWICLSCGNIVSGKCAPKECSVCGYPQGFYELYDGNF